MGAIDPVGITNASAIKALKSNARIKATARLSTVSRTTSPRGGGSCDVGELDSALDCLIGSVEPTSAVVSVAIYEKITWVGKSQAK